MYVCTVSSAKALHRAWLAREDSSDSIGCELRSRALVATTVTTYGFPLAFIFFYFILYYNTFFHMYIFL